MSVSKRMAQWIEERLLHDADLETVRRRLVPRPPSEREPLKPRMPACNEQSAEGLRKRREWVRAQGFALDALAGPAGAPAPESLSGNIENLIGFAQIPVGLIGPLRVNGTCAHGDFYVPMATTEGALVASYHRGAYVISQSGGASVMCLTESVSRAPGFVFRSVVEAGVFLRFVMGQWDTFQPIIARQSRHCRLLDMRTSLVGKNVYLGFEYHPGDAAGQNMVTLATDAICRHLLAHTPVQPVRWYIEANLSGDKKATMLSFLTARGKKVVAEVTVPGRLLERFVHVSPADFMRYGHIAWLGGSQSGSIGVQGHFANALAAIFIACGQDAACVSEASTGLTDMDVTPEGDLYISVTLPNLIVGTVGGGTKLPTARECLALMDCTGEHSARRFAEIVAATVLAGEISIVGALAAGEFAAAHARYGRRKSASEA